MAFAALSFLIVAGSRTFADSVTNAYDSLGRLIEAADATSGSAVFYAYDAAGNLQSQQVVSLGTLDAAGTSISSAAPGTQITIDGTGFSTNPGSNTVKINGVTATVVSATQTQLIVTIPTGATSGTITVQVGTSQISVPGTFTVTPAQSAPTISGFSPSQGSAGTPVTISGTGFATAAANDVVLINGVQAPVTSAGSTSLTITVPANVGSGPLQVTTPAGTVTSSTNFIVPPPGISGSSIATVVQASENGGSVSVPLQTNQAGLVLFNGTQGDVWVKAAIQTQASTIQVFDPHGRLIASSCSTSCLYAFPQLSATGTYTVAIANPVSSGSFNVIVTKAYTHYMDISWAQEGVNAWIDAVNLGQSQLGAYSFSGAANQITKINVKNVANNWTVSLVNAINQVLWSSSMNSSTSYLTLPALPAAGTYTVLFDPQFNGGSFNYFAGITSPSALTLNGSETVYGWDGSNIDGGPSGAVSFSGTANQQVALTITSQQGIWDLNIAYPNGSGQLCVGGSCGSQNSDGNSCVVYLTLPATTTYTVYVMLVYGPGPMSVQMSLASGTGTTSCGGY